MNSVKIKEMVWPVQNYTDKIHSAIRYMFLTYSHLSYTKKQMADHVKRGFEWLKHNNAHQDLVMEKIIYTGVTKLIQQNMVVKVSSSLSIETQWQARNGACQSGYVTVTSMDNVAQSEAAKKALKTRALNRKKLWLLNQIQTAVA
jgi:hypothetical protein